MKTHKQQGGRINLFKGADVTTGGDEGKEDEKQKTNDIRDKEREQTEAPDIANESNEVIRHGHTGSEPQAIQSWVGQWKQGRERRILIEKEQTFIFSNLLIMLMVLLKCDPALGDGLEV